MTVRPDDEDPYVETVRRKAERMSRARKERSSVWVSLGQAGTIGWQFVLPLVGCTLAGHALARVVDSDGPTLAGILIGLVLGLWSAARGVQASIKEDP